MFLFTNYFKEGIVHLITNTTWTTWKEKRWLCLKKLKWVSAGIDFMLITCLNILLPVDWRLCSHLQTQMLYLNYIKFAGHGFKRNWKQKGDESELVLHVGILLEHWWLFIDCLTAANSILYFKVWLNLGYNQYALITCNVHIYSPAD